MPRHGGCPASPELQELADWRVRMNQQVEGYRAELSGLQTSLTSEMSGLRGELEDMKARIRGQLESNARAISELQAPGCGEPGGGSDAAPLATQAG
jgi:hypothetical protein